LVSLSSAITSRLHSWCGWLASLVPEEIFGSIREAVLGFVVMWAIAFALAALFDVLGVPVQSRVAEVIIGIPFALGVLSLSALIATRFFWFLPFMYAGMVLSLIIVPLAVPLIAIAVFVAFCYGFELALTLVFLDVSIDAAPAGKWVSKQIERTTITGWTLAHSLSYQEPDAIDIDVDWLLEADAIRNRG